MTPPTTTGSRDPSSRRAGSDALIRTTIGADAWLLRRGWEARLLGPGSPDWFALEEEPRATRVKAGRLRMVWAVPVDAYTVYAKVAEHPGWIRGLKRLVAAGAAEREMRACVAAAARGLPVAPALAVGRRRGSSGVSVFLSEGVADAISLSDAWSNVVLNGDEGSCRTAARGYIDAVADLFARAHERGFLHGDAHPSNVLTTRDAGGRVATTWIDLKAARFLRGPASLSPSIRSLAQLDQYFHRRATRTERLRFLRRYLAARPSVTSGPWPSLRGCTERLSQARCRHNAALVAQRDRRLHRRGRYFTTLDLGRGWTALVALRLERRHLFPEPNIPDRDRQAWSILARSIIARIDERVGATRPASFDIEGLSCDVRRIRGLGTRLRAMSLGSAHRRRFVACHRERHRDIRSELILGVAERRRKGLVDLSVLIRPGESEEGRPR